MKRFPLQIIGVSLFGEVFNFFRSHFPGSFVHSNIFTDLPNKELFIWIEGGSISLIHLDEYLIVLK